MLLYIYNIDMLRHRKDLTYEDLISKIKKEYREFNPFDGATGDLLEKYRELDFNMEGIRLFLLHIMIFIYCFFQIELKRPK